jgi:UrcA family protein
MKLLKQATAVIVAMATIGPAPVRAKEPRRGADDRWQVVIDASDLNLATEAGRLSLKRRIASAAEQVCGPAPDLRDLPRDWAYRQCLRDAVSSASMEQTARAAGNAKAR